MTSAACCQRCIYFRPDGPDDGECRRHAPVAREHDGAPRAAWPQLGPADWCGDFHSDDLPFVPPRREGRA